MLFWKVVQAIAKHTNLGSLVGAMKNFLCFTGIDPAVNPGCCDLFGMCHFLWVWDSGIKNVPWSQNGVMSIMGIIGYPEKMVCYLSHHGNPEKNEWLFPSWESWNNESISPGQRIDAHARPIGSVMVCHSYGVTFTINKNPSHVSINLPYIRIRHG